LAYTDIFEDLSPSCSDFVNITEVYTRDIPLILRTVPGDLF